MSNREKLTHVHVVSPRKREFEYEVLNLIEYQVKVLF